MHSKNNNINLLLAIIIVLLLIIAAGGTIFMLSQKKQTATTTNVKNEYVKSASKKSSGSNKATTVTNTNASNNKKAATPTQSMIPAQFYGTWYNGNDVFATISADKIDLKGGPTITKDSSPLQLTTKQGQNNTYLLYHNPSFENGGTYWIGTATIDGKQQRVLAYYARMGDFEIYTSAPTSKSQAIQYDGDDYQAKIGTNNLDSLRGHERAR
ncbi:hypothetical protein ACQW5G_03855 [Fructilactobacillus sp. Tb1]|uniref:hypothetical protein n=1 Tax=Fructilactobacillus sp. Tb1 TaxID=3422304 RepID=UPI003D2E8A43